MKAGSELKKFEEFFSENNMEAMAALSAMITAQQQIALELTKLVLEHCVEGKTTREEVFDIYEEACEFLRE